MKSPLTNAELSKKLKDILALDFHITVEDATTSQIYKALSRIVVDHLKEKRHAFMRKVNSEGKKHGTAHKTRSQAYISAAVFFCHKL